MSDIPIDPERVERAIKELEADGRRWGLSHLEEALLAAARAWLAQQPRFKEAEVWRVEWAEQYREWEPKCSVFQTETGAEALACALRGEGHRCISVTGPHKQRVPA